MNELTPSPSILYQVLQFLSPDLVTGIPKSQNYDNYLNTYTYKDLPYVIAVAHTGHCTIGKLQVQKENEAFVQNPHG